MNFLINQIKINSIANLGSLNIGFNVLVDNKATEIAEGVNEKTANVVPEDDVLPPPHPVVQ
ncbi:hypothetical protein ACFPES_15385 [Paenibacillus sp. GCM10023248]|uniref:hypothetical protein n=1 Tax=Bacillales TaxID=1385 RepID=UPI002377E969|nr:MULTISPECIES: hypothetical protein [Bacillales]MDD9268423.1 hypothetical protein [Paenibacillus sp. MAHUQ-63]MDR6879312.1 hypothetical protein [Bacillus sp. 3255]